ncbi:hypothetical protein HOLleu_36689 [Holothuria leucospilota]|uniref:Helix-turn-helix domain-containing protein n=1 Tax=Holothuria leucospilota TaxID=206669 RepID=A0A9Q1BDT6_HOLLE|nr:hypothetical protein HOLleu_36689 [Holothuria leucospilota]
MISAIKFTMELENHGVIPFLDVKVQKTDSKLSFSVYRKPTHTDQYLHFSNHHVSSVVNTLVHRALTLCDADKVSNELDHISKALHKNGYPAHYVDRAVKKQTQQIIKKKASEEYDHGAVIWMEICRTLKLV